MEQTGSSAYSQTGDVFQYTVCPEHAGFTPPTPSRANLQRGQGVRKPLVRLQKSETFSSADRAGPLLVPAVVRPSKSLQEFDVRHKPLSATVSISNIPARSASADLKPFSSSTGALPGSSTDVGPAPGADVINAASSLQGAFTGVFSKGIWPFVGHFLRRAPNERHLRSFLDSLIEETASVRTYQRVTNEELAQMDIAEMAVIDMRSEMTLGAFRLLVDKVDLGVENKDTCRNEMGKYLAEKVCKKFEAWLQSKAVKQYLKDRFGPEACDRVSGIYQTSMALFARMKSIRSLYHFTRYMCAVSKSLESVETFTENQFYIRLKKLEDVIRPLSVIAGLQAKRSAQIAKAQPEIAGDADISVNMVRVAVCLLEYASEAKKPPQLEEFHALVAETTKFLQDEAVFPAMLWSDYVQSWGSLCMKAEQRKDSQVLKPHPTYTASIKSPHKGIASHAAAQGTDTGRSPLGEKLVRGTAGESQSSQGGVYRYSHHF